MSAAAAPGRRPGRRRRRRADPGRVLVRLYLLGLAPAVLALFLALVAVRPPAPLPGLAAIPPTLDPGPAMRLAQALAREAPDRAPGTPGAAEGRRIVEERLRDVSSIDPSVRVDVDAYVGRDALGAEVQQVNVLAILPGRSREAIVVVAHRDDTSPGPGLADNGSGQGLLVALARSVAGVQRSRTFVFASVDGGTTGQSGAERLAAAFPSSLRPVAVVALDGVARSGERRLPLRFEGSRTARAAASLPGAAEDAVREAGFEPVTRAAPAQLLDLVWPGLPTGAQRPFVDRRVPAVQVGEGDDLPGASQVDREAMLALGVGLDRLLLTLDASPRPSGAEDAYLFVRGRVIAGWVLGLLAACLLVGPALVAIALLAGASRGGAPLGDAVVLAVRAILPGALALAGVWAAGALGLLEDDPARYRFDPHLDVPTSVLMLAVAGALAGVVAGRAIPRRATSPDPPTRALALVAVCLTGLLLAAAVAFAANPYAAFLLVPAAHLWTAIVLWTGAPPAVRVVLLVAPLVATASAVLAGRGDPPAIVVHALASQEIPGGTVLALVVAASLGALLLPTLAGVVAGAPDDATADRTR